MRGARSVRLRCRRNRKNIARKPRGASLHRNRNRLRTPSRVLTRPRPHPDIERWLRVNERNIALLNVPQIAAPFEHAALDESNDTGGQEQLPSLKVRVPNPLRHCLADDPRRFLPPRFGEGEPKAEVVGTVKAVGSCA